MNKLKSHEIMEEQTSTVKEDIIEFIHLKYNVKTKEVFNNDGKLVGKGEIDFDKKELVYSDFKH